MSATCQFCGKQFGNTQGVYAHLKACSPYLERPAAARRKRALPKGKPLGNVSTEESLGNRINDSDETFDPVKPLQQRLAAQKLRLQLREVGDAHSEMDSRKREKEAERAIAEEQARLSAKNEERARELEAGAAGDRDRRESLKRERHARRRAAIQEAKREVMGNWHLRSFIDSDVKARVLQSIDHQLSQLPAEDLPLDELIQIAQGVRDKICRDVERAKKAIQSQAAERQRLIRHGSNYATAELRAVDGLDIFERMPIEEQVARALESIEGDESEGDIEDLVDEILEEEGLGWEDDDE